MHTATHADLPRLRELFAHANDTPYDLVKVAEEKCFEPGVAGDPVATIFGDFLGASVTCGKYLRILAVHREHRRLGVGTELLREAFGRGARVVGAEAGNYFTPGVRLGSADFFAKRGRKTAETQNLVCITPHPAFGHPLPASGERALEGPRPAKRGEGGAQRRVRGATDATRERVLEFIKREFGNIWHFEASRTESIHYLEHEGEIAGFAAHDANNKGLGFFGPTGVAKQFRGRGYGRQLLLASLADMHQAGYEQAIIPWTDALDFYAKSCGAKVHERFATFLIDSAP